MVIEALIQRRENIAADIHEMKASLTHLDAVIKMFGAAEPQKPRKPRGEVTRAMLNVLRESTKPLTAAEIATAMGVDVNNVRIALTQQRAKGTIRSAQEPGQLMVWEIVR